MSKQLEDEIRNLLTNLMTDAFNRSMNALRDAKAINTKKMDGQYCGIGSKYYDMVTEQMNITVDYAEEIIHKMVAEYEERQNACATKNQTQQPPSSEPPSSVRTG